MLPRRIIEKGPPVPDIAGKSARADPAAAGDVE
jgi:hypothetical protein